MENKYISFYLICIYFLITIIPCKLSSPINKNRAKILNIIKEKFPGANNKLKYFMKEHEKEHDKDEDEEEEEERDERHDEEMRKNLTDQIHELYDKIDDLDNKIYKRKIVIIFLGIVIFILFIILIIYFSIKCFVLCTKQPNFRESYINRFGEVYIDENGEEKNNKSIIQITNYGAPKIASDKINSDENKTFNPDNYIDKNLYKPYSSTELK